MPTKNMRPPKDIEDEFLRAKNDFETEWRSVQKDYTDLLDTLKSKNARKHIEHVWENQQN